MKDTGLTYKDFLPGSAFKSFHDMKKFNQAEIDQIIAIASHFFKLPQVAKHDKRFPVNLTNIGDDNGCTRNNDEADDPKR